MDPEGMKRRTKAFALRVIRAIDSIPPSVAGREIAKQLVRAASSVGSNYRAACRARSKKEFNAKLQIVHEEADECRYWIEILLESEMVAENVWMDLRREANELTAILTASLITARGLR